MAPGAPLARLEQRGEPEAASNRPCRRWGRRSARLLTRTSRRTFWGGAPTVSATFPRALDESAAVAARRYRTGWVHQGYLEPQVATAWVEPAGQLVVSTSTQGTFYTRDELAKLFGLPVVQGAGAGRGARRGLRGKDAHRRAARRRGGPRSPSSRAARVHAQRRLRRVEPGARLDHRSPDRRVGDRRADRDWKPGSSSTGGRTSSGGSRTSRQCSSPGPYRWPAYAIRAYGVQTNRVGFGSYRAPGAPPAAFAVESLARRARPGARNRSDRAAAAERDRGGRCERRRRAMAAGRRSRMSRAGQGAPALGEAAQPYRPGEGVGVAVATWPGGKRAGGRGLPPGERRQRSRSSPAWST